MYVGLDRRLSREDVFTLLRRLAPGEEVGDLDELLETGADWPDRVVHVTWNESDFPTVVHVDLWRVPEDGVTQYSTDAGIVLARQLAETLGCRTVCDGTGYGDTDAPFWSILWDGTTPYLVNEVGTAFYGDEDGRPLRPLRPVVLPAALHGRAGPAPRGGSHDKPAEGDRTWSS